MHKLVLDARPSPTLRTQLALSYPALPFSRLHNMGRLAEMQRKLLEVRRFSKRR